MARLDTVTESGPVSRPQRQRWKLWLFVLVVSIYGFTASGHIQTIDVQQELSVAASIRSGHGVETSMHVKALGGAVFGKDGRPYAAHDIGMTLFYLPLTLLPGTVRKTNGHTCVPENSTDCWRTMAKAEPTGRLGFLASLLPPLIGALLIVAFAELLVAFRFDVRTSVVTALLLAFTTLIWVYSHISFDATLCALLLTAGSVHVVKYRNCPHDRELLIGSVLLAGAILVRTDSMPIVAVLSAPIAHGLWRRRTHRTFAMRSALVWVAPIVAAVAVNAWYNWLRFGSPFDNGHLNDPLLQPSTPIVAGLIGQVASRGKGMIFYSPLLIFALIAWPRFVRKHRMLAWTFLGVIAAQLLLHAPLAVWSGDEAWASRHTVQITAICFVPLAFVVRDLLQGHKRSRFVTVAFVAVAMAGFVIQLTGVLADYQTVNATRFTLAELPLNDTGTFAPIENGRGILRAIDNTDPYRTKTPGILGPDPLPRFDVWWVGNRNNALPHGLAVLGALLFILSACIGGKKLLVAVDRRIPENA